MKLKFSQKLSAVFRRKYIKIELKFAKRYLLCVCCVFTAFSSFWRPFWEAVLADYFRLNFSSIQTLILRFGYMWIHPRAQKISKLDYNGFPDGFLFASKHDPNGLNWAETIFQSAVFDCA